MEPISCLAYLLVAVLHLFAAISHDDCRLVLDFLRIMLKLALHNSPNLDAVVIPPSIPSDVRTVIDALRINPVAKVHVCCPKCFATYSFNPDDPRSYPEFCDYQKTPDSQQCGRRLRTAKSNGNEVPTRRYFYQDFHHWVGRLYCRPDIEEHLNKNPIKDGIPREMTDMWDGSVLRELLGPDGLRYMDKSDAEGRLVFGLNMDGFNPYGNRQSGKKVSIGGVYMVCLNLPPAIRYKPENVFLVGIIPGPHEPSVEEVNHILRPLVDDLLVSWSPGIFLSQTPKYPAGRSVICALIPLICDLPSARRVAGLGSHSSTFFCSECNLPVQDIDDLNTDNWPARTREDHCTHSKAWRDARSEAERARVFEAHGIRWSELLRLPYWDPTKFVVIDSMHAFYLRIFHRHIRDIWGMDISIEDGESEGVHFSTTLSEGDIEKAQQVFRKGSLAKLQKLSTKALKYLCFETGLHYGARRNTLLKALQNHVCSC